MEGIATVARLYCAFMDSPWMTVKQVCEYAQIGGTAAYRALHTGELVGTQRTSPRGTWRIHRDEVDAWLRAGTAPSLPPTPSQVPTARHPFADEPWYRPLRRPSEN